MFLKIHINLAQDDCKCYCKKLHLEVGKLTNIQNQPLMNMVHINRAVTVAVTTASPAVVGCHRGCVLPPAVVHVTSHTL